MDEMTELREASRRRLAEARQIADSLRHDAALHRLAMAAVFVLEDTHEALSLMRFRMQTD